MRNYQMQELKELVRQANIHMCTMFIVHIYLQSLHRLLTFMYVKLLNYTVVTTIKLKTVLRVKLTNFYITRSSWQWTMKCIHYSQCMNCITCFESAKTDECCQISSFFFSCFADLSNHQSNTFQKIVSFELWL